MIPRVVYTLVKPVCLNWLLCILEIQPSWKVFQPSSSMQLSHRRPVESCNSLRFYHAMAVSFCLSWRVTINQIGIVRIFRIFTVAGLPEFDLLTWLWPRLVKDQRPIMSIWAWEIFARMCTCCWCHSFEWFPDNWDRLLGQGRVRFYQACSTDGDQRVLSVQGILSWTLCQFVSVGMRVDLLAPFPPL